MVDFDKIIEMVELILVNETYDNKSFNDFCVEFFLETRTIPLSKFLRLRGYSNKMPKIMNTRKAGEVIYDTRLSEDNLEIIKKLGYEEIPQLNYSSVMVLRKTTLERNWKKVIDYLSGKGTIDEINRINRKVILPEEKEKILSFLKSELQLTSGELDWFLSKTKTVIDNKKVLNAIKKIV